MTELARQRNGGQRNGGQQNGGQPSGKRPIVSLRGVMRGSFLWGVLPLLFACGGRTSALWEAADENADSVSSGGAPSGGDAPSAGGTASKAENPPPGPRYSCGKVASQQFDEINMEAYSISPELEKRVEETLSSMSPEAKYQQMIGVSGAAKNFNDVHRSPDVAVPAVGTIRGYRYRFGSRGVNLRAGQDNRPQFPSAGNVSTSFPTASLRAASWDLDLERRIGTAIGDETAASLNNALMAPCTNVLRHPFWGRSQEAYSEDSYLAGRMATAMAVGIQEHVVACAKHFVAHNIEKYRNRQNAILDEQTLREIYGRHFEMVVQDGGVGCVMAAYNAVNGTKMTQNRHLLRDVLKAPLAQGGMGFEGFVISDWWAMPGEYDPPDAITAQNQATEAVLAGLDIEVPWTYHYNENTLANADQDLIDEAARRILTQKFRFNTTFEADPWSRSEVTSTLVGDSILPNEEHEMLAEKAALESIVLLQNGLDGAQRVLPLGDVSKVAVLGPVDHFKQISSTVPQSCDQDDLRNGEFYERDCGFEFATDPALGDRGYSLVEVHAERTVGPYAGISATAPGGTTVTSGKSPADAEGADAVVVVVGYTPGDEGEEYYISHGGDRATLDLPPGHADFVAEVLDWGKPTVIVVESGSIVNLPWLSHENQQQATLWAGYPGQHGGLALGKLIFGHANFSGKMPVAWPAESELSAFKDNDLETKMGYFFGYREYDRRKYVEGDEVDLVYPFGHGLSYSTFEYSNLQIPCETADQEAVFPVRVDITNTSLVDGDEVAMLFVKPPPGAGSMGERPWKELKSFARAFVPAGQTVTAELPLRIQDLRRWQGNADGHWVIDAGQYVIAVGKNAEDAEQTNTVGSVWIDGQ